MFKSSERSLVLYILHVNHNFRFDDENDVFISNYREDCSSNLDLLPKLLDICILN